VLEMKKGKQGQGRKKAPSPEVNDEVKEDDEDDEMQLKTQQKSTTQTILLSIQAQRLLLHYHRLQK